MVVWDAEKRHWYSRMIVGSGVQGQYWRHVRKRSRSTCFCYSDPTGKAGSLRRGSAVLPALIFILLVSSKDLAR
jgi:hypothetical protein